MKRTPVPLTLWRAVLVFGQGRGGAPPWPKWPRVGAAWGHTWQRTACAHGWLFGAATRAPNMSCVLAQNASGQKNLMQFWPCLAHSGRPWVGPLLQIWCLGTAIGHWLAQLAHCHQLGPKWVQRAFDSKSAKLRPKRAKRGVCALLLPF